MFNLASGVFLADREFLFPVAHAEIQEHQYTAYQPACRITQCNRINAGGYMGNDEEIDLAKDNE